MKKYKFFINFEKEEQWLNEMAQQGYRFTKKTTGYEFQPGKPDNAVIKMDYRTFKKQEDFEDYCALFEDCGWKHITGSKSSGYQYFRKIHENGDDDIFSDADSKAGRYKRISEMWSTLATTFIPIFVVLISTDSIDKAAFLNPKLLYYTPGLWEETGAAFWKAFLFETPFALFRGFLWLLIPIMIVLYLIFAFKANKQYSKIQADKYGK
ncbi:DUF2812 domain-containing protein [Paenibacillus radicis (ex Xue et al. 2023)]|uniref:DUF2812 domain-containing protein n=1 Tax=Paenibacillus radicis (ex Xue et al. 2023) TaxID=2972489 RepID=A0ABT1YBT1_9BACL|nr:DUF2812 domain-containing protein [Paenibacillus radicis (ex Xue et al. 2023)]MCR8630357.1 DUF2812 domain-containing protein [Paenibacillus radicis (ex Xue et al. 2023)]